MIKYPYTFFAVALLSGVISRDAIGSVREYPTEVIMFVAVVSTISYFVLSKFLDYLLRRNVSNSIKK